MSPSGNYFDNGYYWNFNPVYEGSDTEIFVLDLLS